MDPDFGTHPNIFPVTGAASQATKRVSPKVPNPRCAKVDRLRSGRQSCQSQHPCDFSLPPDGSENFLPGFPRVRIFTPPPRRPRGCQPQVQPRCGVPPGVILGACPGITQERPFPGFYPGGFVGGCLTFKKTESPRPCGFLIPGLGLLPGYGVDRPETNIAGA